MARYIERADNNSIDSQLKRQQMHNVKQTTESKFIERATDVTYAHNLSGNFTFLSQEGERVSGYSREEACQMNITQLLDPLIAAQFCEQMIRDTTKRVGAVYEIDLIAKDGRNVPLEVSTRVVLRDGSQLEVEGIAVPSVIRAGVANSSESESFSSGVHSMGQPAERALA